MVYTLVAESAFIAQQHVRPAGLLRIAPTVKQDFMGMFVSSIVFCCVKTATKLLVGVQYSVPLAITQTNKIRARNVQNIAQNAIQHIALIVLLATEEICVKNNVLTAGQEPVATKKGFVWKTVRMVTVVSFATTPAFLHVYLVSGLMNINVFLACLATMDKTVRVSVMTHVEKMNATYMMAHAHLGVKSDLAESFVTSSHTNR